MNKRFKRYQKFLAVSLAAMSCANTETQGVNIQAFFSKIKNAFSLIIPGKKTITQTPVRENAAPRVTVENNERPNGKEHVEENANNEVGKQKVAISADEISLDAKTKEKLEKVIVTVERGLACPLDLEGLFNENEMLRKLYQDDRRRKMLEEGLQYNEESLRRPGYEELMWLFSNKEYLKLSKHADNALSKLEAQISASEATDKNWTSNKKLTNAELFGTIVSSAALGRYELLWTMKRPDGLTTVLVNMAAKGSGLETLVTLDKRDEVTFSLAQLYRNLQSEPIKKKLKADLEEMKNNGNTNERTIINAIKKSSFLNDESLEQCLEQIENEPEENDLRIIEKLAKAITRYVSGIEWNTRELKMNDDEYDSGKALLKLAENKNLKYAEMTDNEYYTMLYANLITPIIATIKKDLKDNK